MKNRHYYGLMSQMCIMTAFLAEGEFAKWCFVGCAIVYMILSFVSKNS